MKQAALLQERVNATTVDGDTWWSACAVRASATIDAMRSRTMAYERCV